MQWREVSENLDLRNVRRLRPGRFSRKRSKWTQALQRKSFAGRRTSCQRPPHHDHDEEIDHLLGFANSLGQGEKNSPRRLGEVTVQSLLSYDFLAVARGRVGLSGLLATCHFLV